MQLAAQPAALVLAQRDDLRAGADQIAVQPHRLHRRADLLGQRPDQREVDRVERVVRAAVGHAQPADQLAVVPQRFGVYLPNRRAVRRGGAESAGTVGEFDRGIRYPQRPRDGLHDGG